MDGWMDGWIDTLLGTELIKLTLISNEAVRLMLSYAN